MALSVAVAASCLQPLQHRMLWKLARPAAHSVTAAHSVSLRFMVGVPAAMIPAAIFRGASEDVSFFVSPHTGHSIVLTAAMAATYPVCVCVCVCVNETQPMRPYPAADTRETLNTRSSCHTEAAIEIPTSKDAMLLANSHPGGGQNSRKKRLPVRSYQVLT